MGTFLPDPNDNDDDSSPITKLEIALAVAIIGFIGIIILEKKLF